MGRTTGAINKNIAINPLLSKMTVEERIALLANLIVKKIIEDEGKTIKICEISHEPVASS